LRDRDYEKNGGKVLESEERLEEAKKTRAKWAREDKKFNKE